LAVELPEIRPTETSFVDAFPIHPGIAAIALDFIGFERRFLKDIAMLRSILEAAAPRNPELSTALIPPLDGILASHRTFLARVETVVSLHTPSFVFEFVDHLAHSSPIFRSHHAYILQVLVVENFINGFSLACRDALGARLGGRLLIHFFKLPFAWQKYGAEIARALVELLPGDVDPYLRDGLLGFAQENDDLTASIDSIPKLEQISKLFLIEPFPIAVSGRRFIRQGRAWKQCRKALTERELLLFSDVFMYVQPKGGKYMVPASYKLAYLRVKPSCYNGLVTLDIYAPMKSFILRFEEEHERDAWNSAFQEAIVNAKAQRRVPPYKEAPIWIPDAVSNTCMECGVELSFFRRRHHCRNCGKIMCSKCLPKRIILRHISETVPSKVCKRCADEVEREASLGKVAEDRTVEDEEDLAQAVVIVHEPTLTRDNSSSTFPASSDEGDESC
jgi:hypothetical protein